jgi:hypothetical protein
MKLDSGAITIIEFLRDSSEMSSPASPRMEEVSLRTFETVKIATPALVASAGS